MFCKDPNVALNNITCKGATTSFAQERKWSLKAFVMCCF